MTSPLSQRGRGLVKFVHNTKNQPTMSNTPPPTLIYKDEDIIVLNKESGIAVNKARGLHNNVERFLPLFQFEQEELPMFAHRLDKDTSGCLILGRNKQALSKLGKMFMSGRIEKKYIAIINGRVLNLEGRIEIPLAKQFSLKHRWWMQAHAEGKAAITDYKVIGYTGSYTALELFPRTGRTHQLRVHSMEMGHPILGDKIYGMGEEQPLHLHAYSVSIPRHNKTPVIVTAPLPDYMLKYCKNSSMVA